MALIFVALFSASPAASEAEVWPAGASVPSHEDIEIKNDGDGILVVDKGRKHSKSDYYEPPEDYFNSFALSFEPHKEVNHEPDEGVNTKPQTHSHHTPDKDVQFKPLAPKDYFHHFSLGSHEEQDDKPHVEAHSKPHKDVHQKPPKDNKDEPLSNSFFNFPLEPKKNVPPKAPKKAHFEPKKNVGTEAPKNTYHEAPTVYVPDFSDQLKRDKKEVRHKSHKDVKEQLSQGKYSKAQKDVTAEPRQNLPDPGIPQV